MANEKVLVIGGTFNKEGGKPSILIDNFFSNIKGAMIINGGLIDFLENFIKEGIKDYNVIFWLPDNPDTIEYLSDIKKINAKCLIIRKIREQEGLENVDIAKYLLDKKANFMLKFSKDEKTVKGICVSSEELFNIDISEEKSFIENILEEKTLKTILEKLPYKESEPAITLERLHLRIVNDTIDILYRPNHDYITFVPNDENGKIEVKRLAEMSKEDFSNYLKTKTGRPRLTKESVLNLKTSKLEEWYLGAWKSHTDKIFKELNISNPIEEPIWNL